MNRFNTTDATPNVKNMTTAPGASGGGNQNNAYTNMDIEHGLADEAMVNVVVNGNRRARDNAGYSSYNENQAYENDFDPSAVPLNNEGDYSDFINKVSLL